MMRRSTYNSCLLQCIQLLTVAKTIALVRRLVDSIEKPLFEIHSVRNFTSSSFRSYLSEKFEQFSFIFLAFCLLIELMRWAEKRLSCNEQRNFHSDAFGLTTKINNFHDETSIEVDFFSSTEVHISPIFVDNATEWYCCIDIMSQVTNCAFSTAIGKSIEKSSTVPTEIQPNRRSPSELWQTFHHLNEILHHSEW